jgi:hypothetical protein
MWAMRRGCGGCGSCLFWLVVAVLLVDGWLGSTWPLRAVELLTAVAVVAAIAYRQRRASASVESRSGLTGP